MKLPKSFLLFCTITILMGCRRQEEIPMPKVLATSTSIPQPITINQTDSTLTPTLGGCSKQTIPTNDVLQPSIEGNQDKLIALSAETYDNGSEILIMNMDGTIISDITNHPADDVAPKWAPDGKRLAFESNRGGNVITWCNGASDDCIYKLFSINADGTDLKQITEDWTFEYSWSSNSQQIVYLRAVKSEASPYPNDPFLYEVFSVNSDGANLRNLTNYPGYYSKPSWSPDDSKIAFLSGDIAKYPNTINIIYSDGTELETLSNSSAYDIVWTPENDLFILANRSTPNVYKINFNSFDLQQVTFSPETKKEQLALSPDGKWLAYQTWGICEQIRIINTDTGQDYFVHDAHDIGNAEINLNQGTIPPSYNGLSLQSFVWMPNSTQIVFNQFVYFEGMFGDFKETFSIQIDGTKLKAFGDKSGTPSFQP